MAKKRISELPAGSALNGTELVAIVQSGTTKRTTAQDIANLGNASGVEGSGTIDYIAKFTASSTIGDSIISDNGTRVTIDGDFRVALADANVNLQGSTKSYLLQVVDGNNRFRIYDNTANEERFTISSSGEASFGNSVTANSFVKSGGTSAQYLKADGSVSTLTNPITGTGTTNYLPKFTGTSALGNSSITDDGTGIGLTISGYSALTLNSTNATDWGSNIKFEQSGTTYGFFGSYGSLVGSTSKDMTIFSKNAIRFNTNNSGTSALIIDTANAATFSSSVTAQGNVRANNTNGVLTLSNGNTSGGNKIQSWNAASNADGYLAFEGYNIEYGRFDASGRLGIGSASPAYKLDVNGQIKAKDAGFQFISEPTDTATYGYLGIGQFSNGGFIGTIAGTNSVSDILRFGTSGTERMRIATSGNVLIGTTTDAGYKLDVNGTARVSGDTTIVGTATGLKVYNDIKVYNTISFTDSTFANNSGRIYGASNEMVFGVGTSNTEALRIASSGAATFSSSVGTTLGSGGLYLSGDSSPDLAYIGYNYTNINGTESVIQSARSSWRNHFGNGATNSWKVGYRAANAAANSWTDYLTISSSGAATFGSSVTAGGSYLINNTSVSKKGYKFQSPSSNWSPQESGIYFNPADGVNAATTFSVELWDGIGGYTNALSIAPLGAATFSSSVTATQNVIQQTTDSDFLALKINHIPTSNSNTNVGYIGFYSNPGNGSNNTLSTGRIYGKFDANAYPEARLTFSTVIGNDSYQDVMTLKDTSVLIGTTTNAGYKLDVNGTARVFGTSAQLRIQSTSINQNAEIFFASTATTWRIGQNIGTATDFEIYNGGTLFKMNTSGAATFSSSVTAGGDIQSNGIYRDYQGEALLHTSTSAITQIGSSGAGTPRTLAFYSGNAESLRLTTTNQVAIGTASPDASALLQIDSTTQGFLVPRMLESEINSISSPAEGLMVYNTDQHHMCMFDGSVWKKFSMSNM